MSLRKRNKERLPERKQPGDPELEWCSPGSIEHELDMCESGSLRGDDVLHSHGSRPKRSSGDPVALDLVVGRNWKVDLSEENREGDEMSGDEHSSGLQGGESEIDHQLHIATGLPGDRTEHEEEEIKRIDQEEDLQD